MALSDDRLFPVAGADEALALREILGYLNFSNGTPDVRFQSHLNTLAQRLTSEPGGARLRRDLDEALGRLAAESSAFSNSEQARAAIALIFERLLPGYRAHHADLLFHLTEGDLLQPFFVARAAEAVLSQGPPWSDAERIVDGALAQLNDFIGHRPVAVLENGRRMQPYPHERFRPIPLFIRGAGIAAGRYHDLVEQALSILERMPPDILASSYFDLDLLDELALDVRAYDHSHPVYKRTNYTFGEWDPHSLDTSGRYRRFVVRSVIVDALRDWMKEQSDAPPDERICEAGAVLAGTILMASSVSGSGPDTHDSNVNLTSLLPRIARQRDAFYSRLLQTIPGKHGERLRKESQRAQQPFGRIRQHLNLFLADYGCRQMQRANLAFLFAHMGYANAAREQAAVIPSAATRFETEIQLQLTLAPLEFQKGRIDQAEKRCAEAENLLHRGIDCGALVDPWNILGFQGQFPLFSAREDSVADPRVDKLLALMDQFFNTLSRLACEASAAGEAALCESILGRSERLAEFWDRFATPTIGDLPAVHGAESHRSAVLVTRALLDWHAAGESAGDVAFWKRHVDEFQSPRSYAIVVELLLRKHDLLAAMNLLIQWLSESRDVALEAGVYSFFTLLQGWMDLALAESPDERWPLVRKFFDYIEFNAGEWGAVPSLQSDVGGALRLSQGGPSAGHGGTADASDEGSEFEELLQDDEFDDEELEDEEDSTFSAAYESVVYRDSAHDGHFGDTIDEPANQFDTDLDLIGAPIESRLKFLVALSQAWKGAAEWGISAETAAAGDPASRLEAVRHWDRQNDRLIRDGMRLMDELAGWDPAEPDGDPESLSEYDRQLHVKFSLVNSVISACVSLHETSRSLKRLLRVPVRGGKSHEFDELVAEVMRAAAIGDAETAKKRLPKLLKDMSRLPLLYVPLDRDGVPREILAARNLQSLLRTLLIQLPRLGLYRETWHVLRTAYVMERSSPPGGMSITEFDRLLEAALQSTVECLVESARNWSPGPPPERIVDSILQVLEHYMRLWLKHSATMRLCSAEALKDPGIWRKVKTFIRKYGGDLFHPRMLTMGNLRGIVQRGADAYLAWLAENEDPLHPVRLLEDLDDEIERTEAAFLLETILRCIVEKFDRFLEYNTTTTQSDYGEQLHCLLDFLRMEADYERHAWNIAPLELAHEVLSRAGQVEAAALWRKELARRTAPASKTFVQKLKRLESRHGMRLPSVADRINERFVKPLALDRILALVRPAMIEARANGGGETFRTLREETEDYLTSTSGSALELQPWLQSLAEEVQQVDSELALSRGRTPGGEGAVRIRVSPESLRRQLELWDKPLERGA